MASKKTTNEPPSSSRIFAGDALSAPKLIFDAGTGYRDEALLQQCAADAMQCGVLITQSEPAREKAA